MFRDFDLTCYPATTYRKDLPDKTTRWFAAKIGSEFRVFLGADQTPQRNLTLQALLKPWISLNVRREVSRVVNEVLCDCIHLNIVSRDLHADRLHISKLSASCDTIRGTLCWALRSPPGLQTQRPTAQLE